MEVVIAMGIFFIVVTMIFVAIAVFLPEWLGITGKKARQIMKDQEESAKDDNSSEEPKDEKKP
ncbi:hypothetical protein D3C87_339920 [compost metagenome]